MVMFRKVTFHPSPTQVNMIDVFNYIQEENGKKFVKLFEKEAVTYYITYSTDSEEIIIHTSEWRKFQGQCCSGSDNEWGWNYYLLWEKG